MATSRDDAPSESAFLRTLRDVLAPPGGASQPFTEEQAAGLDAINERLMMLNRLPSTTQASASSERAVAEKCAEIATDWFTLSRRAFAEKWCGGVGVEDLEEVMRRYAASLPETPRGKEQKAP